MEDNWRVRPWAEYAILITVTVIAALLRFYKLGEWSYWVDELYTLDSSIRPYQSILHRPFWIVTKLSLSSLGSNAFSLRFLPCIFGIITIPALYFPFKTIFNRGVALLAVFLMAVSPWHIYLSQLARWYSLLLLVSTFSLLAFYFFIERNSLKYLAISILLFFFAFSLHLTAGFILMIAVIYLLLLFPLPRLQPESFDKKKAGIFLSVLVALALLFFPKFLKFVAKWESIEQTFGYWGSTPLIFSLKVLYQLTPSVGLFSLMGLLLLFSLKERKGFFLIIYCLFPPLVLNFAAVLETNVSAKYVFFILPGLLLATSFSCIFIICQLQSKRYLLGMAVIAAVIFPSFQTDYLYFTSGHGNRDRLKEAVQLVKEQSSPGDQIFLPYLFQNPWESQFYFKTIANLTDFQVDDAQFIMPDCADEIDLTKRIWVITIGKSVSPDAEGFYRWIADNTNLIAEFRANKGPEDNTVKVYLHQAIHLEQEFGLIE